jgi:hypothetical protein
MDDNWAFRPQGMKCANCMFFVRKKRIDERECPLGRCRRRSPTWRGWVPVFLTDWCGEHRLDENKI